MVLVVLLLLSLLDSLPLLSFDDDDTDMLGDDDERNLVVPVIPDSGSVSVDMYANDVRSSSVSDDVEFIESESML
jgi:hypothetical protein